VKSVIRAEMRRRRAAVPAEVRRAKSHTLCQLLIKRLGAAKLVCCYEAMKTELDLGELVDHCRANAIEVVFPQKLAKDTYAVQRAAEVDLWICPGLAFTRAGARLGFGGGWYDRFLAAARPDARKIGVAYDFQLCDSLPQGPWDVLLDEIVVV